MCVFMYAFEGGVLLGEEVTESSEVEETSSYM